MPARLKHPKTNALLLAIAAVHPWSLKFKPLPNLWDVLARDEQHLFLFGLIAIPVGAVINVLCFRKGYPGGYAKLREYVDPVLFCAFTSLLIAVCNLVLVEGDSHGVPFMLGGGLGFLIAWVIEDRLIPKAAPQPK